MSPSNTASVERLQNEVRTCRACELWEGAIQAVVGEGARDAEVMFVTITAHPSSILRARDDAERAQAMGAFVSDLKGIATWPRAR